jgi:hypothetical protein
MEIERALNPRRINLNYHLKTKKIILYLLKTNVKQIKSQSKFSIKQQRQKMFKGKKYRINKILKYSKK